MKLASLCIALLLLLLALPLQAQDSYRDFERGLNLTDSQKEQAEGIKRKYIDEWRTLKNESARKKLELRELDRSSPSGRDRARRLENDLNSMQSSKENLYRQYRGEVSGVLNDQQRGRYDKFLDGERKGMPGPRQRGMMSEPRQRGHGR
jgi:hypothetical protein